MNVMRTILPSLFAVTLAFGAAACGKDKPTEAPAPVAPVEDEKPADEAAADKPKDKAEPEAKAKEGEGDEATDKEAGRAARLHGARDRLNGRRPSAIRHSKDPKLTGEAEGEQKVPSEPNPGEAIHVAEPALDGSATPNPASPVADAGTTHPPVEATPPAPNPAAPTPTVLAADPAAAIAADAAEVRTAAQMLDGQTIMPMATVAEITGMQLAAGTPLQGIAIVPGYGSVLYAMQEGTAFGVALQAWQDSSKRETDDRYRRMRLQYPNAEDVTVMMPAKGFYSYFDKLQTLVWLEPTKRMVVAVTCGDTVCNQDQLVRLAKSARERLP